MDEQTVNIVWMLLCAAMVTLMQAGFCCLESGLVRAKNSINVAIKNLADFCVASVLFWAVGFGIMFGASRWGLFGTSELFLGGDLEPRLLAFFLFQMMFCGTATTIVSGAVAERMRFSGYLIVAVMISTLVYPVVGHWVWGGAATGSAEGWLARQGFIDFAGSTVVHSVGGWVALAAVLLIGARKGRFQKDGGTIQGHDLPISVLGVMLLWFGWFGFNGGSTFELSNKLPLILANTCVSASAGGVAGLALSWLVVRNPSVLDAVNGVLAGLVAITASCHITTLPAAVLIGIVGSLICFAATRLLERLKIDDVIGAFPVHACAGVWGTLAVALLGNPDSWGTGLGRWEQFVVQAMGVGACFGWAFGVGFVLLWIVNKVWPLRVSSEAEHVGLNVAEHGATTPILDLIVQMEQQRKTNDFSHHVVAEPYTEAEQIAFEYNRVLDTENTSRREVHNQKRRIEAILKEMIDAVITINERGIIEEFNVAAERMFGYTAEEAVGNNVNLLMPPPFREEHEGYMARYLTGGKPRVIGIGREVVAMHKDGTQFPIHLAVSEITFQGSTAGEPARLFTGIIRDLSQQKQAEADLLRAKESAEASDRAKSEFLANMSHEIRTPLNGIIGFADLLVNDSTTGEAERRDFLENIRTSGKHLLTLINDILDLSKIEAGQMQVEQTTCCPHEIISEVISVFRVQVVEKGLGLNFEWSGPLPRSITTDPAKFRQLLVNLVGNAVKFTEEGSVRVAARIEQRHPKPKLYLDVIDTGVGIAEEKLDCIFDPFVQSDSSVTRKFGGTGLGLAISQRIASALGGSLTVQSQLGSGTTFTASFDIGSLEGVEMLSAPLTDALAGKTHDAGDEQRTLPPAKVLLVEDGAINRKLIVAILSQAGIDIATAENGKIGVECALKEDFDLILMDMQMPVMDGYTAATRLREQGLTVPIIALTAHAMKGDEEKCKAAGCSGYLTKPIDINILLDKVGSVLETVHAERNTHEVLRDADKGSQYELQTATSPLISTLPTDNPVFCEIIEEFTMLVEQQLSTMQVATELGDTEQLAKTAHSLKGASGSAGFAAFVEPAQRLETIAKERQLEGAQETLAELTNLAARIVVPKQEPVEA